MVLRESRTSLGDAVSVEKDLVLVFCFLLCYHPYPFLLLGESGYPFLRVRKNEKSSEISRVC